MDDGDANLAALQERVRRVGVSPEARAIAADPEGMATMLCVVLDYIADLHEASRIHSGRFGEVFGHLETVAERLKGIDARIDEFARQQQKFNETVTDALLKLARRLDAVEAGRCGTPPPPPPQPPEGRVH